MPEKMSLYNIDITMRQLLENGLVFDEETGEVFFTSDDIEALELKLDEKINNIIGYIKELEVFTEALEKSEKDFAARKKAQKSKVERLKSYLKEYMERNAKDKVEVENGIASFRKSSATNIFDEKALLDFINSKEEYKERFLKYKDPDISKTELKKALDEDGLESIPGFKIETNRNLQIK